MCSVIVFVEGVMCRCSVCGVIVFVEGAMKVQCVWCGRCSMVGAVCVV